MSKLSSEVKDCVEINVTSYETWLKYFKDLWSQMTQSLKMTPLLRHMMESINMDKIVAAFKNLKINKAPGED
jgi:hypothetical protein